MDDKNTRSITVKQDDQSDWLIVLVLKHGWMSEDDAQKATTEELKKCVFSRVEKLQGNQNRIYEWEMSVKNSTGLQKFFVETCIGQPFNHEDRNEHFYPDVYRLCRHILDTIHDFKRNGEQPDPSSVFASMQDRGHLNQDNQAAGMHPIAVLLIEAELNPQFTDILKPSKLFTLCYDMMQSKKPGSNIAHPSQLPDEFMRAAYDRLMACGNATFARKASAHLYEVCSKAENRNKILPPDGYRSGSAPGPVRPRRLIDGSTGTVIAEVFRDTNNQRFAPKMRWYPGYVNADRREWRPNPSMATPSRNDRMQHQQQNNVRSSQRRRDANRRSSHGGDDGRGGSSHHGHVGRGSESAGSQRCQSERARTSTGTPRIHQQSRQSEHRSEASRRAQNQRSSQNGPPPSICVSRGSLCHSSTGDRRGRSRRSSPERLPSGGGRGESEPRSESSRRAQNQTGSLCHSSVGERQRQGSSRGHSGARTPGSFKRKYDHDPLPCNLFGRSAKRGRVAQEEEEEGEVKEDSY